MIVINRTAARRFFGAAGGVGQHVDWYLGKTSVQVKVVGIVEDVRQESLAEEAYPEIYGDFRQLLFLLEGWPDLKPRQNEWAIGFLSFAIRTAGDPASAAPVVRQVVSAVDPNIGVDAIIPLTRLVDSSLTRERFYAIMLGVFAGVAGLLAAIGIYGVIAYSVGRRTQEIGVRLALGAQRSQVLSLVLRQGVILTGVALGLAGAAVGSRYLQGMLFGVTLLDRWTFVAVAVAFSVVATLASYLPARRATKVDPVVALRCD